MRISDAVLIGMEERGELTVEAIAAGTLAMIDITGLRLRSMKICSPSAIISHAIPDENPCRATKRKQMVTHSGNQICEKRDDEENQPVSEDEGHQS